MGHQHGVSLDPLMGLNHKVTSTISDVTVPQLPSADFMLVITNF